ncbi:methylated-DNA--[protein]-cysteine S-methyltransferase [Kitasatospora paracochleata]|uniref:Methylated-DNA--protein-cysteine methyltransferase n=1 Tax=Kitasatospora paracochleata TaxID=58354 RepID=A0ABT1J6C5_9ACTN|nr:methylated-DNA--[protein]-cysteine S-methyltransferase [Kitasatospora paracochleata]MCP2312689.1 methylated-DNA-[protein]-cysteine S-methyltransferase [Kitasatospora paracochleata]
MDLSWVTVATPLPSGPMRFAVTPTGVAASSFTGESFAGLPAGEPRCTDERKTALVTARVSEYFTGRRRELDLPMDWRYATGPHRTVLQCLLSEVGYGATITYGELAARSGVFAELTEPGAAARTVGQMMGANPLALLVPCHRVVAADGLGGFGGGWRVGAEVKRWLLTLEGVLPPTLDWDGPAG